jgi:hypothetical protein
MSVVERTAAGLQTVIPGCERRTLPNSTTRADENGQGLLHLASRDGVRLDSTSTQRLLARGALCKSCPRKPILVRCFLRRCVVAAAKREATLSNSIEAILEEGFGSDGVFAFYKIVDYPGRLRIQLDAGCVGLHDISISNNQLHSRDVPLSAAGKHSRSL